MRGNTKIDVVAKMIKNHGVIVLVIAASVIMTIYSPRFLSFHNIINIFSQIAIYGIVSCGMTIAVIGGEFDLSVSTLLGLETLLFAILTPRLGIMPAIGICLAAGVAGGAVNGILVGYMHMNSFIATLSTMLIFQGISLTFSGGHPASFVNEATYQFGNAKILNIPVIVWFFLTGLVITGYILKETRFGRNIFAVGGNNIVAAMSGINVRLYKCALFIILGVLTAIAGILMSSRMASGNALYGSDLTMTVMAGVVIGGTSMAGGKGGASNTFWGMLVLGILFNALLILEVQSNWQSLVKGVILILVITFDKVMSLKKEKSRR